MIVANLRRRTIELVFVVLCTATISSAASGKVDVIGPLTDSSASDALRKVLEPKGYRVLLDDGSVACEIWLRNSFPAATAKEVEGALFPQLSESTLVGVLSFPKAATDYRGQPIKPGLYTLRYELLPNDGNHLGAAPSRDILLLVPAVADPDPVASFKFADLVNLSRKASGTKHPAPLSMVQPESDNVPAVSKDDQNHWTFAGKVKIQPGDPLLFGLVVKGTAQQ